MKESRFPEPSGTESVCVCVSAREREREGEQDVVSAAVTESKQRIALFYSRFLQCQTVVNQ
jgi:hypothetical protein